MSTLKSVAIFLLTSVGPGFPFKSMLASKAIKNPHNQGKEESFQQFVRTACTFNSTMNDAFL